MKPIIEVRNLSKQYKIGQKQKYLSLRDSVTDFFKNKGGNTEGSDFWALDDVSFDVQVGESIGIIGRNGAGKSTLLKILSRITPPTKGKVILRGRMASLLEVGTGFHPELTGRENVYFNASILGLRKVEVNKKFDEIVAFSGVEQFIDTPLKHYSSGMQLRLAFAVAAHLEPEILVIDEVLAVGDAEFQKKCLGKMDEVSKSGRTVLFVSHNMSIIRKLCTQGIILEKGKLSFVGNINKAIQHYEQQFSITDKAIWHNKMDENPQIFLNSIEIQDEQGLLKTDFLSSESIYLHFYIEAFETLENITLAFDLCKEGSIVFRSRHTDGSDNHTFMKGETYHLVCHLPAWFFNVGYYEIRPILAVHGVSTLTKAYEIGLGFYITLDTTRSSFHTILTAQNHPGLIFPMLDWTLNRIKQV